MNGWLAVLLEAAMFVLGVAIVLCVMRLMRGPSVADRAMALDQISVQAVGIVTLYSIRVNDAIYLDAALVVALIGFLSVLAFARYIERGAKA
jgi:multisubunit Na+/H+ antiporter MnhF subunit